MNEVWKKPPVSFEAYQAMVGREIGVSSWHSVDQNRINDFADVIEDHRVPYLTTADHHFRPHVPARERDAVH